jgi:hypothetical protein
MPVPQQSLMDFCCQRRNKISESIARSDQAAPAWTAEACISAAILAPFIVSTGCAV